MRILGVASKKPISQYRAFLYHGQTRNRLKGQRRASAVKGDGVYDERDAPGMQAVEGTRSTKMGVVGLVSKLGETNSRAVEPRIHMTMITAQEHASETRTAVPMGKLGGAYP